MSHEVGPLRMAPRLPLREVVTSVHTHKDMPCRPQPLYMLQLWGIITKPVEYDIGVGSVCLEKRLEEPIWKSKL